MLATSDNNATANIPGGGGGLISVNIMVPTALVEGATKAHLDGDVTGGTTLLVRSRTSNTASATSHVISIGVLGGGVGITSDAEVTSDATSEASVGSTATVTLSGDATIDAGQTADNSATATANGTSTGLISGGIYQTKAIIGGAVLAAVDGSITSAALTVNADGDNTAVSTTTSFGLGGISFEGAGALAQITNSGDVTARTGSTASAHGPVSVTAISQNTATAKSDAASGGLGLSLAVNMPTAKVDGATLAQFNGDADNATSFLVQATSANTATATADIFSAGLIGAGAGASSDAEITSDASTQALVGSASTIEAPGVDVQILATSANHATAVADGNSLSIGLSISVMIPTANAGGLTKASFDGDLPGLTGNVSSLTVRSRTSNQATANAHVVSVSIGLGGAGGDATAIVGSSADNEASIGPDAVIVVDNGVLVDAGQSGANKADATIDGGAGGIISGVFMGAESHVGGAVLAQVDGNVTADSLTITANGSNTANATTQSFQISALGFSGAGTLAEITSAATVTAGTGSNATISTTHAVTVSATSHNTATSISDAASGGLLGSFSVNLPKALNSGGTLTEFDGNVTNASALTVQSTSNNTATATAQIFSLGGIAAGAGASSDAEVGSGASTTANVGSSASLAVPSGAVQVLSTSANHANATANGFTGSLGVSVAIMKPTAQVAAATTADFDGDIPAVLFFLVPTATLTVRSRTSNSATAHAKIDAIALIGGGAGGDGDAEITSSADNTAMIGPDANVNVSGAVTVDAGQNSANTANATIDATSFGTVSGAVIASEAHINGDVLAELDGSVDAGGSLTVQANGTNNSTATTDSFGLGGISFSGAGSLATIDSQGDVTAKVGSSASVQNQVSVTATSTNTAKATSDAATGGLLGAVSVNEPTAKVDGATLAEFDGDVANGTAVGISSTSNNTATAEASIISIGLGFAGAGASSDAEIGSDATTNAIVGSTSTIDAPGVDILVAATSSNSAVAKADGGAGGFGVSVVVMKPTAIDGGGTNAGFNGDITSAKSLTVRSRTADSANAHTDVVSISLVAGLTGGFANASITSAAVGKASIGSTSSISVAGAVLVDAGQNAASTATANADGGSGGLVSGAAVLRRRDRRRRHTGGARRQHPRCQLGDGPGDRLERCRGPHAFGRDRPRLRGQRRRRRGDRRQHLPTSTRSSAAARSRLAARSTSPPPRTTRRTRPPTPRTAASASPAASISRRRSSAAARPPRWARR